MSNKTEYPGIWVSVPHGFISLELRSVYEEDNQSIIRIDAMKWLVGSIRYPLKPWILIRGDFRPRLKRKKEYWT